MLSLVPRPIRDVVVALESVVRSKKQIDKFNSSGKEIPSEVDGLVMEHSKIEEIEEIDILLPVQQIIKAIARTALAILGMIGSYKIGGSMAVTATLGTIVSLPAFAIAGGSLLIHRGITGITASVASGSLTTIGYGVASLIGGWLVLEKHDIIEMGFGDYIIRSKADSYAVPLMEKLDFSKK